MLQPCFISTIDLVGSNHSVHGTSCSDAMLILQLCWADCYRKLQLCVSFQVGTTGSLDPCDKVVADLVPFGLVVRALAKLLVIGWNTRWLERVRVVHKPTDWYVGHATVTMDRSSNKHARWRASIRGG
jgi:hypothetical protein